MKAPYFKVFSEPELQSPVFVEGLPGLGAVGKLASQLLIESMGATSFAELYSPYFPDSVIIEESGVCRLPRYEFYAYSKSEPNLIILIGDFQPSLEDVTAHYEICSLILDFIEKYGCKRVITLGGYPTAEVGGVYVAATSDKLAAELAEQGAAVYRGGRIVGAAGLVVGLAKLRGLEGTCILGATPGIFPDRSAAMAVFKFLVKILGLK